MLTKFIKNKKEAKEFKENYGKNIHSDCVSNVWGHYARKGNIKSSNFNKILFDTKQGTALYFLLSGLEEQACKDKFGSCDFKFQGNREYRNWVFEYNQLIFIGPIKLEVVTDYKGKKFNFMKDEKYLNSIVDFQKTFYDFVLSYAVNNDLIDKNISSNFKKDVQDLMKNYVDIKEENGEKIATIKWDAIDKDNSILSKIKNVLKPKI